MRTLRAEYYTHIRDLADDLAERARDGEIRDEEAFWDAAHESIDGSQWTFVYVRAYQVLLVSDNESAIREDLGELPEVDDLGPLAMQASYYAQMADLRELVYADMDTYGGLFDEDEEEDEDE
jgi:hypothetical protein